MTADDRRRLSAIRRENRRWLKNPMNQHPEIWDTTFLLKIIDDLLGVINNEKNMHA